MTYFQRSVPARGPLKDEILGEPPVRQEILGLERVQRLVDERLAEFPSDELAAELGARVLAAGQ